jgi:small subunit ribosomal protein S6
MLEYELMYIVPTSFTDEEVGAVEGAVGGMLDKANATVLKTVRLGKFRLAYPIRHERHGHYVLVRFQAEASAIAGLNDTLRLSPDKVLRHIILSADEAGEEKFDLVQFQEVNVESREDRARRAPRAAGAKPDRAEKEKDVQAQKEGVAALEGKAESADAEALSPEELEKKIASALEEKA